VVAAVAGAVVVLAGLRRRRLARPAAPAARVPEALRQGATRTWVVFGSPWCAACGPAAERLRAVDPAARVVLVDAAADPALARALAVRTAPTAVLAGPDGRVEVRLVGAAAVARHAAAVA